MAPLVRPRAVCFNYTFADKRLATDLCGSIDSLVNVVALGDQPVRFGVRPCFMSGIPYRSVPIRVCPHLNFTFRFMRIWQDTPTAIGGAVCFLIKSHTHCWLGSAQTRTKLHMKTKPQQSSMAVHPDGRRVRADPRLAAFIVHLRCHADSCGSEPNQRSGV